MIGSPTGNFLAGNGGTDILKGSSGTGPDGLDRFVGGGAEDTVSYDTRTDPITARIDDPAVIGAPSGTDNDDITSDIENLTGGQGNDSLFGNDSNNDLSGGPGGSDTLSGGQAGPDGADNYIGGSAASTTDTVTYAHRSEDLIVDIGGGADDPDGDNVSTSIENLTGGSGDDDLTGSSVANTLVGGAGDDELFGGSGTGPDGIDVFGGGTNGTAGGANGETGDTVAYSTRTDNLTLSIGGATDAPEGEAIPGDVENISGGLGNDTISGDAGANLLRGGDDGDDVLRGGTGTGPDGADVFRVGAAVTTNTDTVTYSNRTDALTVDIGGGSDDIDGDDVSADADALIGGSGPDFLTGDADANTLEGGDGEDSLSALGGPDTVLARDGFADTVNCGTEADTAVLDEGTLDSQAECETLDQPPLQAPNTTILSGPPNRTPKKKAKFTFEADEQATFTCKLDNQAARACTSPAIFRRLREGRHTMTITATDLAGQADPTPAVDRWKVRSN